MYNKHYVGLHLTGFEDRGEMKPISRVTLNVDDEHVLTAGDDTGLELIADCPHATQTMANAILAKVKGYRYQMFAADSATLDPAAELGDGITAGGVYSVISCLDDDGRGFPDAKAPGQEELEEEFPTAGPVTQVINRKTAETRASIAKTAGEIRLEVSELDEENKSLIRQNAEQIELRVTKDGVISAINLSPESVSIQAGKISLEGAVSINRTFQIDKDGYLRCTGGTVGGFSIGTRALYNGLSTLDGTENGVYVGTDGISIGGGRFKATSSGAVTASSVTIKDSTISNSSLGGTLNSASGTFTGTHSGGSLSSTYGSFYGNHYSGYVSNCSTNGTTFSVAGGSLTTNGGYTMLSTSGVIYLGAGNALHVFNHANYAAPGNISCEGTKSRTIRTAHFGARQLDAFETPLPTFADYGMGRLDESGVCYIRIDPVFAETVNPDYLPTVFLTKYGEGDVWAEERGRESITVRGTPGLRFAWEARYMQANCYQGRLRVKDFAEADKDAPDYDLEANIDCARHTVDYGMAGCEYFENFERRFTA